MVVKDEANRLLLDCLDWNMKWADCFHIYDDQSIDATVEICKKYTPYVTIRPNDVPNFLDNEGLFRQAAWNDLSNIQNIKNGDWIVCIDADEFFISDNYQLVEAMNKYIEYALSENKNSISLKIPEIWKIDGNKHHERIDGFWSNNRNIRIIKYMENGKFNNINIGSGSVPTYGISDPYMNDEIGHILHYGYLIAGEAQKKYTRYSISNGNAHSSIHINSIIKNPELKLWEGNKPWILE